jgi:hypothetical protein
MTVLVDGRDVLEVLRPGFQGFAAEVRGASADRSWQSPRRFTARGYRQFLHELVAPPGEPAHRAEAMATQLLNALHRENGSAEPLRLS